MELKTWKFVVPLVILLLAPIGSFAAPQAVAVSPEDPIAAAKRGMIEAGIPEAEALGHLQTALQLDPHLGELTTITAAMIDLHEAGALPESIAAVFNMVETQITLGLDRALALEEISTITAAKIDMLAAGIPEAAALGQLQTALQADPHLGELTTITAAMIDLHEAKATPESIAAVFNMVEAQIALGLDRTLALEEISTITAAKIDMIEAGIPAAAALGQLEAALQADPHLGELTTITAAAIDAFEAEAAQAAEAAQVAEVAEVAEVEAAEAEANAGAEADAGGAGDGNGGNGGGGE